MIKNKTFISFRGYSTGGEEVVRDGVLQTTNHTNVWSSRCEVVSNEWSNIPCNCKLNWWWKETQHFHVEWKWVCLIPVTFYFWSHCLASINFVMYGETFLGLADTYGKSILYQAIGSRFVKYQEISTQWAHGMNAFVHGGHTCLVLVTKKSSILTAQYTSSTKYVA